MRTHRHSERRLSLGGRQIVTEGLERRVWQDLYHLFMTASWRALFASFAGFFLLFNLVFALLYQLQPAGIANVNPAGYWGLFFFSVETLATVGYGDMHPQSVYAHTLAAIEIFMGMMSVGVIAGVDVLALLPPDRALRVCRARGHPSVRRPADVDSAGPPTRART